MDFQSIVNLFVTSPLIVKYLVVFGLGLSPFSEGRGAIIAGIGMGLDPFLAFSVAIIANILAVPVIFYFLKLAHINDIALKIFGKRAMRKIERNRKRFEIYEELALILFVAIPFPFTGAWMGTFIAHILKFDKRRSLAVISIGVVISCTIVLLSSLGILSLI